MNILITTHSATVIFEGKPYTIHKDHRCYDALIQAYRDKDEKALKRVIDALNEVKSWAHENAGNIEVRGGTVYYKGEHMDNVVTERIVSWVQENLDPQPMINFLERLLNNPSYQSREELLLFLEHSNLPIQEDGRFLAYKRVKDDYTDVWTGKFDNSVGQVVSMARSDVNDNRNQTCSAGLHFCSKEYLGHFGGAKVMLLAIDPADVVSIPNDYNNAKGRCCRYEVIEEVGGEVEFKSSLYDSDANQERTRNGQFLSKDNLYRIKILDDDGDTGWFDGNDFNYEIEYDGAQDDAKEFKTYKEALEFILDPEDMEWQAHPLTLTIVNQNGNEYDSETYTIKR